MFTFLVKGIFRDRTRSLLPLMVVILGVFITVFLNGWMRGVFSDMIDINANYTTGHLKVMTRAYAANDRQKPNDLALMEADTLIEQLQHDYPAIQWVERIYFGGLLDVPDRNGQTRAQVNSIGRAIDLLHRDSKEVERMNIIPSLVHGRIPNRKGEAIISDEFAKRYELSLGDTVSIVTSTMYGSMSLKDFEISGTIHFGYAMLDRGAVIIDISDARDLLDMQHATGEILGYLGSGVYDSSYAREVAHAFNQHYANSKDEYAPVMRTLEEQENLETLIAFSDRITAIMALVFILAMSVVLWNIGLLGGLRRYAEFGIRLALGEKKLHIYMTVIYEAVVIGLLGSTIGTILGLSLCYYLEANPVDFSFLSQNIGMMLPQKYKAIVWAELYYIGFIPGFMAMTIGASLSGIAIFKRKTSQLFKELEV